MSTLKRAIKALVTPVRFSYESGHFLSALLGKSVDAQGHPLPMLTYPALDALKLLDLAPLAVLEWGTGQSSLYFSTRVKTLVGVEASPDWARYVDQHTGGHTHVHVLNTAHDLAAFEEEMADQPFDIVLIDGPPYRHAPRLEAAQATLRLPHTPRLVIVDNADLEECTGIIQAFREAGYLRVDFVGYSPGAYYKQCTSFMCKPEHAAWALGNDAPVLPCSPHSHGGTAAS